MGYKDVEMGRGSGSGFDRYRHKAATPSNASGSIKQPNYEETRFIRRPCYLRFIDTFKRDPVLSITPNGVVGANGRVFQPDAAALNTANSPLSRKLKGRHLQMIAIG
ncbi:unnamed protein product, partial [Diplocarpon coronariae]